MKNLIAKLTTSDELLGRFINTLSFLEYIGARKIFKSQPQATMSLELLTHAEEECRHALVLKKAALKFAPEICQTYEKEALLCGEDAKHYIQKVDHGVSEILGVTDPYLCYHYTTFLVENRATSFYAAIDEVLSAAGKAPIFRGILVEEEKHLSKITTQMDKFPEIKVSLEDLQTFENQAFDHYLQAMRQAVYC